MKWLKLKYSAWSGGLLDHLNEMRSRHEMCDVKIILENNITLQAHSNVLAAASPFFKSILVGTESPEVILHEYRCVYATSFSHHYYLF